MLRVGESAGVAVLVVFLAAPYGPAAGARGERVELGPSLPVVILR